ncbi:hypothetical protein M6B38_177030 [Iris pallida]|uniref:Uncharacterized protein n=1 Tax=Iris pallida TaxID=29817 RepID=A0AAX6EPG1_IRIPA|nr:hypothetical protein M6B38_177030 [Iris pallida]
MTVQIEPHLILSIIGGSNSTLIDEFLPISFLLLANFLWDIRIPSLYMFLIKRYVCSFNLIDSFVFFGEI